MTTPSHQYVKALFLSLVKAAGGAEASAAALTVPDRIDEDGTTVRGKTMSHQRISQLTSLQSADMPTLMQIATLEAAVGRAVITSAMAEAVEGREARGDLLRETSEGVSAAARTMEAVVKGERPDEIAALAVKTIKEMEDVRAVATAKAANAA